MSSEQLKLALGFCQLLYQEKKGAGPATRELLESIVSEVLTVPTFLELDRTALLVALEERITVHMDGTHRILGSDAGHEAWLPTKRSEIEWRYWDRYRLYMGERVPPDALESIDRVTNDIIERLEDPQRGGHWDRRGLVMGHVQSGKTANYTGLICKAADAGYKVIIVLSGIHDSLRSQTQIRLEEGFLGFMNSSTKTEQAFSPVGVGLIDPSLRANTVTSRAEKGDFNRKVASQFGIQPGGLPLLFVVKKNASVLKNLNAWIQSCANATDENSGLKYVRDVPALIVDDEADQASIDTKQQAFDENGKPDDDHNPTKINAAIRRLLRSFSKVAYVGYTATPFANIFIHDAGKTAALGDDIFPRSFIVSIPAPSNYMGPLRIFGLRTEEVPGEEGVSPLPILRAIDDYADSIDIGETGGWMPPKLAEKTEHRPLYNGEDAVPPSLRLAIMSFVLASAVRKLREPSPVFNTMLVHVVRFTKVQLRVKNQVESVLKEIQHRLSYGDGRRTPTILQEFENLWLEDFVPTSKGCIDILGKAPYYYLPDWALVRDSLVNLAKGIKVRAINGSAGDVLDYEEHKNTGIDIIAVGGDKLSRGLTLEGLSVSYFLRASRMYDTLMQMGRWFGYREKYIDVCRLYTTDELVDWFTHITQASQELQREFEHMVAVGGTPEDYGLKVRSHPAMLVTSAVKMRSGTEMRLTYSGQLSETINFKKDQDWLQSNFEAVSSFLGGLGKPAKTKGGYLWKTGADEILTLLTTYRSHELNRRADTKLLANYINAQNKEHELENWTVYLVSNASVPNDKAIRIAGVDIGVVKRSPYLPHKKDLVYRIRNLLSPVDEAIDLTVSERNKAIEATRNALRSNGEFEKAEKNELFPMREYIREARDPKRGLLIIYPLGSGYAGLGEGATPVMALALSFPKSEKAVEISYTVNNVFASLGGDDVSY